MVRDSPKIMNNKKFETQVSKEHYFEGYDSLQRFISYFYQIDSVIKTEPKTVLEIGIGNKVVSNYLKQMGFQITTCDFDKNLQPDIIADIREMPFKDNSFDTIIACQILEHIPLNDVKKALAELKRVSKKNVIVSISYNHYYIENIFRIILPFFERQMHFTVKIPWFSKFVRDKEHQWELGGRGCSKKKTRDLIKEYFKIRKEFQPILNSNRYFFILEK